MANFYDMYMEHLRKQRRKSNPVGKIFFFSAVSAVVGAGVALLTSPRNGRQNREEVAKFGRKVGKQAVRLEKAAEERFDALKEDATGRFEELRSKLSDRVADLKGKLGEKAEDAVNEGEEKVTRTTRNLANSSRKTIRKTTK